MQILIAIYVMCDIDDHASIAKVIVYDKCVVTFHDEYDRIVVFIKLHVIM